MKHFIFDLGGVLKKKIPHDLIKDEPSVGPELKGKLFDDLESGRLSIEQYVNDYADEFNKKNISYEEFVENYYEIGKKYGGFFPDVIKTFDMLSQKGIKIYLLSNLHKLDYHELQEQFDIKRFEKMFLSYKMGCVKPEPIIYQKVIEEIADDPSNMYFFDDKEKNVEAAKNEGMNAYVTVGENLFDTVSKVLEEN